MLRLAKYAKKTLKEVSLYYVKRLGKSKRKVSFLWATSL